MLDSAAGRLAWGAWAVAVVLTALGLLLLALSWSTPIPDIWGVRGLPDFLGVTFATVGAVVEARRPENPIGRIFLAAGLGFSVQAFTGEYGIYALLTRPGVLPGGVIAAWITSWIWAPSIAGAVVLLFLLFPTGRLLSPRWRPVIWLSAAAVTLMVIGIALAPGPLLNAPYALNPLGIAGARWMNLAFAVGLGLAAISLQAASVSLVARLRRARGDERQQLKWIAATAVVVGVMLLAVAVFSSLKLADVVLLLALDAVPVSAGIAILKHRLYDIDLIIRRTLVYATLTACLALVYFGGVVALQAMFRAIAGQSSDVAIVGSTLAIAALFQPLRGRIQEGVDRRFYRRKYDAARVLAAVGETCRAETDLEKLTDELLRVVDEAMQPADAWLWSRPPTWESGGELLARSDLNRGLNRGVLARPCGAPVQGRSAG